RRQSRRRRRRSALLLLLLRLRPRMRLRQPRASSRGGMTARVCIGQIGAAHGVRGEVRLKAFTEDPLNVTRYGALESEDGKRRFEIESVRPAKDMLVARLKGVTD